MAIMTFAPMVSGCFGGLNFSCEINPLDSPTVAIYPESKCITWDSIHGATQYLVYCNDKHVGTVESSHENTVYKYEFGEHIDSVGEYEFYVVAKPKSISRGKSQPSEKLEYVCEHVNDYYPGISQMPVQTASELIPITIDGMTATFTPLTSQVDGYELHMTSNLSGYKVFPLDISTMTNPSGDVVVNLLDSQFNLQDTIYALRIGVVTGESHIVISDIGYVNSEHQGEYTENIYLFDGYINDAYIETLDELRNYVYYNFIHRIDDFTFKISPRLNDLLHVYYEQYTNTGDSASVILQAVADTFNYFIETRDGYSIGSAVIGSANSREFRVRLDFLNSIYLNGEGKPEPIDTLKPPVYYYEEIEWSTFYDTCGYTMRDSDSKYINNAYHFPSDNQFLYAEVESSEELYWAVENHITPICVEDSKAEKIYGTAKGVLNSIISDQMTDYEKVLSIYDWICANTSYDYYALTEGAYDGISATLIPAFYLEGVFDTGYAVCDGFSKAFSLMCNMEGIDAIRIIGYALSGYDENNQELWGGHAWNKVGLDFDTTDDEGQQFYLVDITWTEMLGSYEFDKEYTGGDEVSSHEYFLVDDKYVEDTHKNYEHRSKFNKYVANERYNYYENTYYNFNPKDYSLAVSTTDTKYDLVIKSSDELVSAFYYILVNNLDSIEVVIDYAYMKQLQIDNGGSANDYNSIVNNLKSEMENKKFNVQYLYLRTISNSFKLIEYNSRGNKGLLMVIENNLRIDANNEAGLLTNFFSHYEITGEYDLCITNEMLNISASLFLTMSVTQRLNYCLSQAQSLFASSLASSNINMEFELVSLPQAYDRTTKVKYKVTITLK